jgi:hypothetical protein
MVMRSKLAVTLVSLEKNIKIHELFKLWSSKLKTSLRFL